MRMDIVLHYFKLNKMKGHNISAIKYLIKLSKPKT